MPVQVSRTDTGQFVLIDPVTDTVVIDDDLAQGFAKLEQAIAGKPPISTGSGSGSSAFAFRGGSRHTPILLAVVLPFAWLAVLYLALANLLAETAVERDANHQTQAKLDELEREVQALRSQLAGAPKSKPPASTPADDGAEVEPAGSD